MWGIETHSAASNSYRYANMDSQSAAFANSTSHRNSNHLSYSHGYSSIDGNNCPYIHLAPYPNT
jgi:hypothetical protein